MTEKLRKFVKEAAHLGEFTLSQIDASAYTAAQAVKQGFVVSTKKTRASGGRGRPATVYKVTAKGKKLSA